MPVKMLHFSIKLRSSFHTNLPWNRHGIRHSFPTSCTYDRRLLYHLSVNFLRYDQIFDPKKPNGCSFEARRPRCMFLYWFNNIIKYSWTQLFGLNILWIYSVRLFRAFFRLNLGGYIYIYIHIYIYSNALKDEISITLIYKLSICSF
jgi:hypothetical protein